MNQYQTIVVIVDLVRVGEKVSVRQPTGKDNYREVGEWSPYTGLSVPPAVIPSTEWSALSHDCALAYVQQGTP